MSISSRMFENVPRSVIFQINLALVLISIYFKQKLVKIERKVNENKELKSFELLYNFIQTFH